MRWHTSIKLKRENVHRMLDKFGVPRRPNNLPREMKSEFNRMLQESLIRIEQEIAKLKG